MRLSIAKWLGAASLLISLHSHAANWVQGQHYYLIQPAVPTNVAPGKVEVVEVFSYGCPACFQFYPTMDKLKASLPKHVQVNYVPASWNSAEAWPLFQRAYLAANAMGISEKTHNAMFNAIWAGDELAVIDRATNRPKKNPPTIDTVAAFYARTAGVKKEEFLNIAKSFTVESKMKSSDAAIKSYRADQTPTIVVNGKYRVSSQLTGGASELIELVNYLVAKETK